MLVKERMKRDPVTVKKGDSFRYALKLIRKEAIRHLPVLERLSVETIMTRSVIIVTPETDLLEAAKLLLAHKIGCLPVVEQRELLGIITEGDLLRALVELQEQSRGANPVELVVEDRPGTFEAVTTAAAAGPATVISGSVLRQGERRPIPLIRTSDSAAGELRRRLAAAGHPPIN